jgi:hypothetical protein
MLIMTVKTIRENTRMNLLIEHKILTQVRGVIINGAWLDIEFIDTTYTHHSELQVITALSLICTL